MSSAKTTTDIARSEQPGELSRSRYEPRDLTELITLANIVVKSNLCPSHIKRGEDALLIMQRGAEMGITAANALQNMYVVSGKVSMSAQLAVGVCKASPSCKYFQCIEYEPDRVTWETHRVGNPNPTRITFTKSDAQIAGLWGSGTWKKYPQNMMSARASMNLARMEYPDLMAGIYTPEELSGAGDSFDQAPTPPVARPQPMSAISPEAEPDNRDQWKTLNAKIHAKINGIGEAWTRAFHDYITASAGVDSWADLTVEHLEMVLSRFTKFGDPIAWIKKSAADYYPSDDPESTARAAEDVIDADWDELAEEHEAITANLEQSQ